jgi:hypothetical protein
MRVLCLFVLWCLLLAVCWPLAVLALVLAPVVWLLSLPVRLLILCIEGAFGLLKGVLLLPARLLGSAK